MRRWLVPIAALAMLATLAPSILAAANTVTWKATMSVGTITITAKADGSGSAKLALKSLPKSATIAVSIRKGTCSAQGTAIANLAPGKSNASGALSKTMPLTASVITKMRAATSLVVTVKSGTFDKCGVLKAAPVASPATTFADGTYKVGIDVAPGTYRTRTQLPAGDVCYWKQLSGFGGAQADIIEDEFQAGFAIVTISPSDVGFASEDCGTWTPDLSRVTASQTTFGDGAFIVNTDILPGTYQAPGGEGYYWKRVTGWGGSLDEIIENDCTETATPMTVTVLATDTGFYTDSCGTWTLQP